MADGNAAMREKHMLTMEGLWKYFRVGENKAP